METNNNHEAAKQLAQSFNGSENAEDFKLITLTIQDVNPVFFSLQCENALKTINPEVITFYGVNNLMMRTNVGEALVFIATVQYWGDEAEHKEWIEQIRRNNLLIKP